MSPSYSGNNTENTIVKKGKDKSWGFLAEVSWDMRLSRQPSRTVVDTAVWTPEGSGLHKSATCLQGNFGKTTMKTKTENHQEVSQAYYLKVEFGVSVYV